MEHRDMMAYARTRGSNLFVKKLLENNLEKELEHFKEIRDGAVGLELYNEKKNKFFDLKDFYCVKCDSKKLRTEHKKEKKKGKESIGSCSLFCESCKSKFLPKDICEDLEFGMVGNDRGDYILDFYLLMFSPNEYLTRNFCSGVLSSGNYLPLEHFRKKNILRRFDMGSFSGGSLDYVYGLNTKTEKDCKKVVKKFNNIREKYDKNDLLFYILMGYINDRKDSLESLCEKINFKGSTLIEKGEDEFVINEYFKVKRVGHKEKKDFDLSIKHIAEPQLEEIYRKDREELPFNQ